MEEAGVEELDLKCIGLDLSTFVAFSFAFFLSVFTYLQLTSIHTSFRIIQRIFLNTKIKPQSPMAHE